MKVKKEHKKDILFTMLAMIGLMSIFIIPYPHYTWVAVAVYSSIVAYNHMNKGLINLYKGDIYE